MDHVIIGAGPAGVVAAETLRKADPGSRVTLVCGEAGLPYARMAIPYALSGRIAESGTRLRRDPDHFAKLGITLVSDRVTAIDPAAKRLTMAEGALLGYDRLLIATGSSPARPRVPGIDLPGVQASWTLDDLRAICQRAKPGSRVTLLGAGFVSCIILQSLVQRGCEVTISCGSSGRMVRSMMDETAGGMIMRWCRARGVRVLTGGRPKSIDPGLVVTLDSGDTITADLVIVGTGVRTNTEFLAGSGIEIDEGIKVDETLRTNLPDIFAAGDVAQGFNQITGRSEVHAIQPVAVEHGRVAALNMAGRRIPFIGSLPMNTLDTLGLISCSFGQWAGLEGGERASMVDEAAYRYIRLEFLDGRLIGANTVGVTQEIGIIRGLIQSRLDLGNWVADLKRDPSRLAEAYLSRSQNVPS